MNNALLLKFSGGHFLELVKVFAHLLGKDRIVISMEGNAGYSGSANTLTAATLRQLKANSFFSVIVGYGGTDVQAVDTNKGDKPLVTDKADRLSAKEELLKVFDGHFAIFSMGPLKKHYRDFVSDTNQLGIKHIHKKINELKDHLTLELGDKAHSNELTTKLDGSDTEKKDSVFLLGLTHRDKAPLVCRLIDRQLTSKVISLNLTTQLRLILGDVDNFQKIMFEVIDLNSVKVSNGAEQIPLFDPALFVQIKSDAKIDFCRQFRKIVWKMLLTTSLKDDKDLKQKIITPLLEDKELRGQCIKQLSDFDLSEALKYVQSMCRGIEAQKKLLSTDNSSKKTRDDSSEKGLLAPKLRFVPADNLKDKAEKVGIIAKRDFSKEQPRELMVLRGKA